MPDIQQTGFQSTVARIRRAVRTPFGRTVKTVIAIAVGIVVYQFISRSFESRVHTDIVDLKQSIERVEELATLKSHLRFAVVVREESGNVIVRQLADNVDGVGMNSIGSMLFEDPTMIVELHGVATYGVRLNGIGSKMTETDTSVVIAMPPAEVLDVKLVSADTRVVAQMKGLFRSNNQALLAEANRHGERFVADLARADSTLLAVSAERTRSLIAVLVEQSGSRAEFR